MKHVFKGPKIVPHHAAIMVMVMMVMVVVVVVMMMATVKPMVTGGRGICDNSKPERAGNMLGTRVERTYSATCEPLLYAMRRLRCNHTRSKC